MAAKKTKESVKLPDELAKVADELVISAKGSGSISEDDIQIALQEIDVSDGELSLLYETLRSKNVEITSVSDGSAEFSDTVSDDDFNVFATKRLVKKRKFAVRDINFLQSNLNVIF